MKEMQEENNLKNLLKKLFFHSESKNNYPKKQRINVLCACGSGKKYKTVVT